MLPGAPTTAAHEQQILTLIDNNDSVAARRTQEDERVAISACVLLHHGKDAPTARGFSKSFGCPSDVWGLYKENMFFGAPMYRDPFEKLRQLAGKSGQEILE